MPPRDDKRQQRQDKRAVKRAGNKHRRQQLKRDLAENPEEAAHAEESFGRHHSSALNGIDRDSTRLRDAEQQAAEEIQAQDEPGHDPAE